MALVNHGTLSVRDPRFGFESGSEQVPPRKQSVSENRTNTGHLNLSETLHVEGCLDAE